jgi:hypothetical protein
MEAQSPLPPLRYNESNHCLQAMIGNLSFNQSPCPRGEQHSLEQATMVQITEIDVFDKLEDSRIIHLQIYQKLTKPEQAGTHSGISVWKL